jgi:hypothetical protein
MPSKLEPIEIDGSTIWIEVEPLHDQATPSSKTVKTASGSPLAAAGVITQSDIANTLLTVVGPVHAALASISPKEASIELSLGLKGEVGVFIAKSEGSASIKVTAKWIFEKPTSQKG